MLVMAMLRGRRAERRRTVHPPALAGAAAVRSLSHLALVGNEYPARAAPPLHLPRPRRTIPYDPQLTSQPGSHHGRARAPTRTSLLAGPPTMSSALAAIHVRWVPRRTAARRAPRRLLARWRFGRAGGRRREEGDDV